MKVDLLSVISAAAALAGIVFGWLGFRRASGSDFRREGTLKSDTEYIKRRIDDILLEQKETNKSFNLLAERVTRVEESVKQAHKRIDSFAGCGSRAK